MKNFLARLALVFLFLAPVAAFAQSTGTVVTDCSSGVGLAYVAGTTRQMTLLPTGQACISGTFSASITFPTIGAAVPATADYIATNVAGTLRGWSGLSTGTIFPGAVAVVDASGNQITSFGSVPANSTATGTITTTQSVTLTPTAGQSSVGIQITGTWTGTLFVEGSIDGTNFIQTTTVPLLSGSVQSATITASGMYQANLAGFASFRIRGSTVASGTATVTLVGTSAVATVMADNPFPVTGYTGMTPLNMQGTVASGSASTAFPVLIGGTATGASGGNAQVVKAAAGNTAAVADVALVVADPNVLAAVNAPTPAGTNTIGNVNGAPNVKPTDCSGSVTTGGTAQNAFAAGATKHGFTIMSIDTTEPLWISFTTTAAASGAGSYVLAAPTATTFAGANSYTTPVGFGMNTALSVFAATTGHKWTCTWW